jgi:hypothetical protein
VVQRVVLRQEMVLSRNELLVVEVEAGGGRGESRVVRRRRDPRHCHVRHRGHREVRVKRRQLGQGDG